MKLCPQSFFFIASRLFLPQRRGNVLPVVKYFHILKYIHLRFLPRLVLFLTRTYFVFGIPKKFAMAALSQQFPFPFIEEKSATGCPLRMPFYRTFRVHLSEDEALNLFYALPLICEVIFFFIFETKLQHRSRKIVETIKPLIGPDLISQGLEQLAFNRSGFVL